MIGRRVITGRVRRAVRGSALGRRRIAWSLLSRTHPVSGRFGYDRGTPVDRVYIECFLERHAGDIAGTVLEFGDPGYTSRFGGSCVSVVDVMDVDPKNPRATIVDDIGLRRHRTARFDCIVCTQVLHLVPDMSAALETLHALLRPGGVLLATVPGMSQIDRADNPNWYWAVTRHGARRLVEDVFGPGAAQVEGHGNVLAAVAFLEGVSAEELRARDLRERDPRYDLVVTVRARRADEAVGGVAG